MIKKGMKESMKHPDDMDADEMKGIEADNDTEDEKLPKAANKRRTRLAQRAKLALTLSKFHR